MENKADQLNTGKIETTPVDLSQLSNVAKKNVVKKSTFNKLVKKLIILIPLILVI